MSSSDPLTRFGSAKRPDRPVEHLRPDGVGDATIEALGKLSEALEVVEHARGLLYAFHRHTGMADLALQDAIAQLRAAGLTHLADELDEVLVGRDVVNGLWTFQIVEAYDANYWTVFRAMEQHARDVAGVRAPHVFEAEMKVVEQGGRP